MTTEFVRWKNIELFSLCSFSDSGIIASTAVASMNPAPSAMKYFRHRRSDFARAISEPPTTLAPAAVTPSSRASSMRFALAKNIVLARVAEQNHIAILHDVLFSFELYLRALLGHGKAAGLQQVFPIHHFGFDESALDVAVNRAGSLLRVHSALDGPRAALRLAASEKRNQSEQPVAGLNQPIVSRFRQTISLP